jgi:hypothetical protein
MALVTGRSAAVASTCLFLALRAPAASAGSISLAIAPRAEIRAGRLEVQLGVRNAGDEQALSLSPLLGFRGRSARGETHPVLHPGETWETALELADDAVGAGRWPFRIGIDYTDANGYPFHALSVGTVAKGAVPPATLGFVGIEARAFADSGALEARLKNLSAATRTVEVAVEVPEGIELAEPVPALELAGWEERALEVSLVNRTGLPGSRYAIFASAEYDDGGFHQTVLTSAALELVAPQAFLDRHGARLALLAGLLVLAWLAALAWRHALLRR